MTSPGQSALFTTFTELVSTTYRLHQKEVVDNVSRHNALYRRIAAKGKTRLEDGGLSIVTPLDYAQNSTYQRYSGFDPLNISASDVLTAVEFPWRQVAVNVAASGLDIRTNSGENRIVNLVKARVKNAQRTFANGLSLDLYSDGSATNQINGIQALISDTGTGTVGGIDSSVYTFWKSVVQSAAAPLIGSAITPSATTIELFFGQLYNQLTRGTDQVDLIVADLGYFTFYETSQTSLKRYTSDDNSAKGATGGFVSLKYKNADVVFDTATSGIPSNHAYFLNTDYMEMVVHQDANMEIMPEMKSVNQDAIVIPILFQGNMTISNRSLMGVAKA
ncbi:MAG TPA: phage major capsid protein [Steroidobacteraceae bacterium]|nr:phage major capsid protein [Steroidobacteraceae bacterium]